MKTIVSTFFTAILLFTQLLASSAWAEQTCEQKHKEAIKDLVKVVRNLKDHELANLILNGENSGIDIYDLTDEQTKRFQASAMDLGYQMKQIMARPNCKLNDTRLEALKLAIQPAASPELQAAVNAVLNFMNWLTIGLVPKPKADDFLAAVQNLSNLGGLQGISNNLDRAIAYNVNPTEFALVPEETIAVDQ